MNNPSITMHKITSAQFKAAVELDPAWASKLTEPLEITDYCDMRRSNITHLSPFLHFTGKNNDGWSADFWGRKFLKVAEGKFEGYVRFSWSGIEKIGDLSCGKDNSGNSAFFSECKSLKIAEGKFEGFVDFDGSSIEKIGDLSCGKDESGDSAVFSECKFLKVAEGKFEGYVNFALSGIEKIGDLSCGKNDKGNSAYFSYCKSLKVAEGKFPGNVGFNNSSIEKIGDLSCGKDNQGIRLDVRDCPNLTKIPITFNPKEIEADPKLIEKLEVDHFIQKKRAEIVEIEL